VRGLSFLSGCYIVPTSPNSCTAYFFTQVDLGGALPSWLVNKATKSFKNVRTSKMVNLFLHLFIEIFMLVEQENAQSLLEI